MTVAARACADLVLTAPAAGVPLWFLEIDNGHGNEPAAAQGGEGESAHSRSGQEAGGVGQRHPAVVPAAQSLWGDVVGDGGHGDRQQGLADCEDHGHAHDHASGQGTGDDTVERDHGPAR
ncbi:hypothetical protein [Streptomyces sp. NPDC050355]|uniref:hypothetical protein n=1 Tax=Streptomyces sp. NPDC050355 TaxID=3365609 RepID=UPI00378ED70E